MDKNRSRIVRHPRIVRHSRESGNPTTRGFHSEPFCSAISAGASLPRSRESGNPTVQVHRPCKYETRQFRLTAPLPRSRESGNPATRDFHSEPFCSAISTGASLPRSRESGNPAITGDSLH